MTAYKDYRTSQLFKVADRILAAQQSPIPSKVGDAWEHYFPFHAENVMEPELSIEGNVTSFLTFLRFSYYRPRDINRMMTNMQEILQRRETPAEYVTADDFSDPSFRDAHAEYLLGEIRDQLLFYYRQDEFDLFLQFFSHLRGKLKFSYAQFIEAFNDFIGECNSSRLTLPQFFETANVFLQFLYDQNVICFKERPDGFASTTAPFIRWCFRERTLSNMAPKVRVGVEYEIFYGLSKALNVGRKVRVGATELSRYIGTIIDINRERGFGFIRGGPRQSDYYFKLLDFDQNNTAFIRVAQKVSFEPAAKYGKPRAINIKADY